MAWDFLRRFLKLVGGKFVSKLGARLLIFQYYDRINLEFEEQKKKFRVVYQKSEAELALFQHLTHRQQFKIGMSSVLEESRDGGDEVSILEVHSSEDFWDDKTVSSHYEDHGAWDFDLVEL